MSTVTRDRIIILKCDVPECRASKTADVDGRGTPRDAEDLRAAARDDGWSRFRPRPQDPLADSCPSCTRRRNTPAALRASVQ